MARRCEAQMLWGSPARNVMSKGTRGQNSTRAGRQFYQSWSPYILLPNLWEEALNKMLTLGFWGHCFHMQRILFFGRGSSRIMTFGFLAYDPDLFFAKEGRCKTQAFQNAEPSIVEAYSIHSPAHEKHMRHLCVPRYGHARSDAKSVAHMSKGTRGQNYTRAGRKFYQSWSPHILSPSPSLDS